VGGVAMTVKRLRDAGAGGVWLFFIPVINVLFFLALCALPPRERARNPKARRGLTEWIERNHSSSPLARGAFDFLTCVLGFSL